MIDMHRSTDKADAERTPKNPPYGFLRGDGDNAEFNTFKLLPFFRRTRLDISIILGKYSQQAISIRPHLFNVEFDDLNLCYGTGLLKK
jgi:hypothetical protein